MPNAARRRPRPLSDLAMSLIIRSPHSLARSHSFLCTRPTTAPAVAAAALVSAAAAAAATDASGRRALPGRALPPGFEHESPPLPRPGPNHSLHPCPPHCPCHKHLLPLASSRARDTGCEGGRKGGREPPCRAAPRSLNRSAAAARAPRAIFLPACVLMAHPFPSRARGPAALALRRFGSAHAFLMGRFGMDVGGARICAKRSPTLALERVFSCIKLAEALRCLHA